MFALISNINLQWYVHAYVSFLELSFIAVAMNSRDRYEIIGLRKIPHSINNLAKVIA